ncbi:MAG TPA: hypothetical protein VH209_01915 [Steroidobacteraceae bacterium]|nr:hypothetical protein [Steroidobacteraceae bacterium]
MKSIRWGALRMWPEQRRAEWVGEPLVLTSTEFSVLELLLRHGTLSTAPRQD